MARPLTPLNVAANAVDDDSITVTWTAAGTAPEGEAGFTVSTGKLAITLTTGQASAEMGTGKQTAEIGD